MSLRIHRHQYELSETVSSVILPVSLIAGAIGPDLFSIAVAESSYPLSSVFGPSRICVGSSLLTLSVWIVWGVCDCFFQLNRCKVSAISSLGLLDH